MATYDFDCNTCNTVYERQCLIKERESLPCEKCGDILALRFSPPTALIIPTSFKYAYSDLYGTSSEKDYLKAHPNLVPQSEVRDIERTQDKNKRKAAQADKTVAEMERAFKANKTLVTNGKKKK